MLWVICVLAVSVAGATLPPRPSGTRKNEAPRAHDRRLEVTRFAAAPDIVHPIGVAIDTRGRLLVIESHTHFRPQGYKGPRHDRIRVLEDTDGDGRADRFTTFYEGTTATMDIAVHPDGSVYLATRNELRASATPTGTARPTKAGASSSSIPREIIRT